MSDFLPKLSGLILCRCSHIEIQLNGHHIDVRTPSLPKEGPLNFKLSQIFTRSSILLIFSAWLVSVVIILKAKNAIIFTFSFVISLKPLWTIFDLNWYSVSK